MGPIVQESPLTMSEHNAERQTFSGDDVETPWPAPTFL